MMADISLVETVSKIDPHEWDDLVGGNILLSHSWLRLIEDTSKIPTKFRYLLARDNSKILAALFCWGQNQELIPTSLDHVLYGRFAGTARLTGLTLQPSLICGALGGYHQGIMFRKDLSGTDRKNLLTLLLVSVEDMARIEGHTLCFRQFPTEDNDAANVLSSRRYLCTPEFPLTYLDIEWNSFATYLKTLKRWHPGAEKSIRNEINRSRRAGVMIHRLKDTSSVFSRLHAVADAHYKRLNTSPFPYQPEFFGKIKEYLGDKVVIYTAVKGEQIIGVLIMLRSNGNAFLPIIGIDTEYVHKDGIYFNLAFNQPIRDGIESGLRRLYFGILLYGTKLRRGCRLADANIYLKTEGRISHLIMRPIIACRSWKMRLMLSSLSRCIQAQAIRDLPVQAGDHPT
jgi:predicted N-acyltransferase